MHAKNQRNTIIRRKDQSIQKGSEIKQMKELAHKYIKAILYIYIPHAQKSKKNMIMLRRDRGDTVFAGV